MLFCGERTVLLVSVHHWKGTPRIALSQNISEAMMDLILAAGSVWNCVSAQCWQDDWTKVWVCNCQSIGQKHLFCFHLWLFHTTSVWVSPLYLNLWTIRGFFWQVFCYFFGFVWFFLVFFFIEFSLHCPICHTKLILFTFIHMKRSFRGFTETTNCPWPTL